MDVLGRLAGLAEAAWARGAVTEARPAAAEPTVEIPALEADEPEFDTPKTDALEVDSQEVQTADIKTADIKTADIKTADIKTAAFNPPVEAPLESAAVTAAIPLAQVREVFATLQKEAPPAREKWRYAIMVAAAVLVLALLSFYGWRAWYRASVSSRASRSSTPRIAAEESQNSASAAGLAPGTADIVRPVSRSREGATSHGAKPVATIGMAGAVVQRRPRSAHPTDGGAANTGSPSPVVPANEDLPQMAASTAAPNDLGRVLSTPPTLPKLGVPISQGVSGGVLVRKVQPVYPPEARRMHVEGKVVLDGIVTVQGEVDDLKLISGDAVLAQAAMEAVRQWRYTPFSLNGQPIPKQTRITISFIAPQ
jgi:TonB family protein